MDKKLTARYFLFSETLMTRLTNPVNLVLEKSAGTLIKKKQKKQTSTKLVDFFFNT